MLRERALTAIATFDGMPYDLTLVNGSITVTAIPVTAIPEPGSLALASLAALLASTAIWLQKRSANHSL